MEGLHKRAMLFAAIGLALYGALYAGSEWLLYRHGHTNPFFKLETADARRFDWVILGASHAMPFDFDGFGAGMEQLTARRILNLASPGTGPLYNRFVLENFLRERRTAGLLYVVDSFGFYSRQWNEERFSDAKLLRRTPFRLSVARLMADYVTNEGVDARALLDYATGFSKINNRERFERDAWEGEAQFDRAYRPSAAASRKRVDYLFPEPPDAAVLARYLAEFQALLELAQQHGARVTVIKTPVPEKYRELLPGEENFDRALADLLAPRQIPFHDFSRLPASADEFFDTDHLNRKGLTRFVAETLAPLLTALPASADAER